MSEEVKPLLPKNPSREDLLATAKILDYLIQGLKKRKRHEEIEELALKKQLCELAADVMKAKGLEKLRSEESY